MLKGQYRINPQNPAAWSKLLAVCKSLASEGATYETTIRTDPTTGRSIVCVSATGGTPKRRKRSPRRIIAAPVKIERIRKEAERCRRSAIRPSAVPPERTGRHHSGWQRADIADRRQSDKRVGRLVARAIARGETTIDPVTLAGGDEFYRVFEPQTVNDIIDGRRSNPPSRWKSLEPSLEDRKAALAEYQYWRELEILSGQREHWKPGLMDENASADDQSA